MRFFFQSIRMQWRCAVQYRASFIMQSMAQLAMVSGDLMAVLVLLDRFTHIGGWSPAEILFFFGMMQMTFAVTECIGRGFTAFVLLVRDGDFDTMLLRPRPLLLQVMCAKLDPRRLITALVGILAIAVSSHSLGIVWTAGKLTLLVLSTVGTVLLLLGLFLVEATMCFFSVKSIEMVNVLTCGGRTACEYPVDIYPAPIRLLFTYVAPFALCMHYPVSVILSHPMMNAPVWTAYLSPLAGAAVFVAMALVWRYVGVRHYASTGS